MHKLIPVSEPDIGDDEAYFVNQALKRNAISGFYGEYLPLFEKEFSEYCGCDHGIAVSSGTAALHLALAVLDIGAGDEVLVPTLTNMATFFSVIYQGATPIPIDSDPDTLNLNPELLRSRITSRTKAILVVHLFGHPVDMDPVLDIASKYGLYVIEDCAEAHGALYKGKKVGGLGDIGCFSFYANKIITTGEGGMLTLHDTKLAEKARSLKGLAFGDSNKFMHKAIGYNYRLTNLQAAIGHAQFKKIEDIISKKRLLAKKYYSKLSDIPSIQLPIEMPYARSVYWMYHILLNGEHIKHRQIIMKKLLDKGIETRENFIPYNMQDFFIQKGWTNVNECPVANNLSIRGFYLPSSPALSDGDISYICDSLICILAEQ